MRKFILPLLIVLSYHVYSKEKQCDGYYIFYNNDTFRVKFIYSSFNESIQLKIPYLDSLGKKSAIHPNEAKEVCITIDSSTVFLESKKFPYRLIQPGRNGQANLFLLRKIKGKINVYYSLKFDTDLFLIDHLVGASLNSAFVSDVRYGIRLYQINDRDLISESKFRKNIVAYTADCNFANSFPKQKDLTPKELIKIVRRYNAECTN